MNQRRIACSALSLQLLLHTYLVYGFSTNINGSRNQKLPFLAKQVPPTDPNQHDFGEDEEKLQARYVWERLPPQESTERAHMFHNLMETRRTVRFFSSDPVPLELIQACVATAGTAPSGAHQQPWTFVVVQNPTVKSEIRELVEEEEQQNYQTRMSDAWKKELQPIMSGLHSGPVISKPYLTEAPYIVVLMKHLHGEEVVDDPSSPTGQTVKQKPYYYVDKSCGIAAGYFVAALHNANLASLCSTPMHAEEKIRKLLGRPEYERVFLLMPVGYPAEDCTVPYRDETTLRKPLEDIFKVV